MSIFFFLVVWTSDAQSSRFFFFAVVFALARSDGRQLRRASRRTRARLAALVAAMPRKVAGFLAATKVCILFVVLLKICEAEKTILDANFLAAAVEKMLAALSFDLGADSALLSFEESQRAT